MKESPLQTTLDDYLSLVMEKENSHVFTQSQKNRLSSMRTILLDRGYSMEDLVTLIREERNHRENA